MTVERQTEGPSLPLTGLCTRSMAPWYPGAPSPPTIVPHPSNHVVCERYGFGRVVFCRVAIPKLDPVTQHQRHGSVGRDVGGQPCDAFAKANNTLTYLQTRVQDIQNCNTKYSPLDWECFRQILSIFILHCSFRNLCEFEILNFQPMVGIKNLQFLNIQSLPHNVLKFSIFSIPYNTVMRFPIFPSQHLHFTNVYTHTPTYWTRSGFDRPHHDLGLQEATIGSAGE